MSMFGMGGGGSSPTYTPAETPFVPMRGGDGRDAASRARTKAFYIGAQRSTTYKLASRDGGAAAPSKSYTSQLFNASGGI